MKIHKAIKRIEDGFIKRYSLCGNDWAAFEPTLKTLNWKKVTCKTCLTKKVSK